MREPIVRRVWDLQHLNRNGLIHTRSIAPKISVFATRAQTQPSRRRRRARCLPVREHTILVADRARSQACCISDQSPAPRETTSNLQASLHAPSGALKSHLSQNLQSELSRHVHISLFPHFCISTLELLCGMLVPTFSVRRYQFRKQLLRYLLAVGQFRRLRADSVRRSDKQRTTSASYQHLCSGHFQLQCQAQLFVQSTNRGGWQRGDDACWCIALLQLRCVATARPRSH